MTNKRCLKLLFIYGSRESFAIRRKASINDEQLMMQALIRVVDLNDEIDILQKNIIIKNDKEKIYR